MKAIRKTLKAVSGQFWLISANFWYISSRFYTIAGRVLGILVDVMWREFYCNVSTINDFPLPVRHPWMRSLTMVPILTSCESPGYSIVSLGLCWDALSHHWECQARNFFSFVLFLYRWYNKISSARIARYLLGECIHHNMKKEVKK